MAGLHVERMGEGTPVLCMHGGMGFDLTTLRPWLQPLSGACELIFYDHCGNGRSAPPSDWQRVTHETWVDDAEALRLRLGFERVVVFGHSWGGFIAQEFALKYPASLAGLILCSTAPALDYGAAIVANAQARGTERQVAALLEALTTPLPDDAALASLMGTIGPLYFHCEGESLARRVFAGVKYSSAAFNRGLFHCSPSFNTLERLSEITVPTLLLSGEDDWIMPPAHGLDRLAKGVPHASVERYGRSGHFPFVEERDAFAKTVRGWLGRL